MGTEDVAFHWKIVVFLVWAVSNIGLNFFNSWAERPEDTPGLGGGGFNFPFFYTMFHMAATATFSLVSMLTCKKPPEGGLPHLQQFWDYKYQLMPIAFLTTLNYGLNNSSLALISLYINQSIKASAPLPTALFEFLLLRKVYNLAIYGTISLLVGGCILANASSFDHPGETSLKGVIFVLLSLLASTLGPVCKKIVMSGTAPPPFDLGTKPPLEPAQAVFWDSSIAFVAMLIIWLVGDEREASIAYLTGQTANPNSGWLALGIISFGATIAFVFNLAGYYYIHFTSALTSTVGSIGVKVLTLMLSALDPTSAITNKLAYAGVAVVSASIALYAYLIHQFKLSQQLTVDDPPKESTPLAGGSKA
jgi:hypothetical protein